MLAYSTTNAPEDGPILSNPADHDDFGLKKSKVMNVIDVEILELGCGRKSGNHFSSSSSKDEAHFACGRHFERLEGGNPTAPLKASHRKNGRRQHHSLNLNRP